MNSCHISGKMLVTSQWQRGYYWQPIVVCVVVVAYPPHSSPCHAGQLTVTGMQAIFVTNDHHTHRHTGTIVKSTMTHIDTTREPRYYYSSPSTPNAFL